MIGTTLKGAYTVERKIAVAGFATVYRGVHKKLKRTVAIKFLNEANESVTERFLREAESMAKALLQWKRPM